MVDTRQLLKIQGQFLPPPPYSKEVSQAQGAV